jgi:capsid portal protein
MPDIIIDQVMYDADKQPVPVRVIKCFDADIQGTNVLGSMVDKASSQMVPNEAFTSYISDNQIETPPIPLESLLTLALNNVWHMACVQTKVADIVGQGYTVRPRSVMFPTVGDREKAPADQLDAKGQQKIIDFLDLSWRHGESFTELMSQVVMDQEIMGQGYTELERDVAGNVVDMYSVKGVTMRLAKGGQNNGFWQARGQKYQFFAPYQPKTLRAGKLIRKTVGEDTIEVLDSMINFVEKAAQVDESYRQLHEMAMFAKPTSSDTRYGCPDTISVSGEMLVQRGIRDYRVSYFDAATIPRLIIICKGEIEGDAADLTAKIARFLSSQRKTEILNKVLVLEAPEGSEIEIKELKQARMDDKDALSALDEHSGSAIRAAHRVPLKAIPGGVGGGASGVGDSEIQRYVSSVVRPGQHRLEDRINWILRSETGIDDWCISYKTPDLLTEKEKSEIWKQAIDCGRLSVNDVRLQDNQPPVKGGDEPILRIAGQPPMPLSRVDEFVALMSAGANAKDINNSLPVETGKADDMVGKALYIMQPSESLQYISDDDKELLSKKLEEIVYNKDDVRSALGLE